MSVAPLATDANVKAQRSVNAGGTPIGQHDTLIDRLGVLGNREREQGRGL
ncbi:hypothetical protein [Cupriavidus pinatubonensis]|uniref:Uncharacterized protein n=1 Tax=Cupriavidus pinatubonensis TaxID=248026 RepID=A0ABN7ZPF6_9BURK|nr:hypothetical protein [Cupriavidus pinatubonensis]CAG9187458.1 hypothetical protein LMG23994_06903 [Cupriavidus pinatubonensis]